MLKKRLLVIGNSYMNFISKIRRAPERSETVFSPLEFNVMSGGFGVVSSVAASIFGMDTVLCTRLGDDEYGEKIRKNLISNKVDTRFIVTDKRKPTGVNSITEEDNHKKRTIVFQGANSSISFDDIETAFTSYPDALLISLDLREDLVLDAVKFSNNADVKVILTCGEDVKEFDYLSLGNIEVFCPTREVAYKLSGIDPIDANSCLHACIKIANILKCKYVVIKLGERGSFVFDGVYSQILPPFNSDNLDMSGVDKIFSSALAAAYLLFDDINKATKFANSVALISASKEGEYTSLPEFEEVEELFDIL